MNWHEFECKWKWLNSKHSTIMPVFWSSLKKQWSCRLPSKTHILNEQLLIFFHHTITQNRDQRIMLFHKTGNHQQITQTWIPHIFHSVYYTRVLVLSSNCSAISHFLSQCWINVNWTLGNFNLVTFESKENNLVIIECNWKCLLPNGSHFIMASMCEENDAYSRLLFTMI